MPDPVVDPATPVTVSEPPLPAETVAPNDPWSSRTIFVILGVGFLVIVCGAIWLADHGKDVPEWLSTVAVAIVGGMIQAASTRMAGAASPRLRRQRDVGQAALDLLVKVIVVVILVLLVVYLINRT